MTGREASQPEAIRLPQLQRLIATDLDLPQPVVRRVLRALLDEIAVQLVEGRPVTLHGLGRFEPVTRPGRTHHDVTRGAVVRAAPKRGCRFIPGRRIRQLLHGGEDANG